MKHKFTNLRDTLSHVYKEFDSFSIFRVVFDEIDRLGHAYFDNFFKFNHHTGANRLN